jgi:hypothetical protein
VKRNLFTFLAALALMTAGALYAQSRDRSRDSDRDGERSSERSRSYERGSSSGGSERSRTPSNETPIATTATAPATQTAAPASRPAYIPPSPNRPLPGDYALLSRKSIFARDRRAYVERPRTDWGTSTQRNESNPAPAPPAVPVLVGVLVGDQDLIAYIEDPDSGKLWPIAAGDPLPGTYGTVRRVTLDDITIGRENESDRRIAIGQNLAGEAASSRTLSSSLSDSGTSSTSGTATTGPALDPNEPGISIEEKMKRRRAQQVGR